MNKKKHKWPLVVGISLLTLGAVTACYYWVNIIQPNIEFGEAVGCRSRLRQIALAGSLWSIDHHERFPTNFMALEAHLTKPVVFACPKEKSNPLHLAKDWSAFDPKQSSYEIVSPGMDSQRSFRAFARCKVHGFACYGDGRIENAGLAMHTPDLARAKRIALVGGSCFLFGIILLLMHWFT